MQAPEKFDFNMEVQKLIFEVFKKYGISMLLLMGLCYVLFVRLQDVENDLKTVRQESKTEFQRQSAEILSCHMERERLSLEVGMLREQIASLLIHKKVE